MVGERKGQSFWVVPFSFLPGYDSVGPICLWYFKMNIQQLLAWYVSYHLPCPACLWKSETFENKRPQALNLHAICRMLFWTISTTAECYWQFVCWFTARRVLNSKPNQCLTVFLGFREDYFLVWTWYGFPSHPRPSEFSGIFSLDPLQFSTQMWRRSSHTNLNVWCHCPLVAAGSLTEMLFWRGVWPSKRVVALQKIWK